MNEKVRRSRGGLVINSPFKRTLMVVVFLVLVVAVCVSYRVFSKKNEEFADRVKRIERLEDQISAEDEKSKQLKKQEDKVINDEDIESIARQELGLIKKDEIVIRPN
jgi:cell division protein FtsL